ncbi:hypothetical protein [Streptomyces albipurpureus]|uniref:Uncharacterized protein n=1 Tax=Streptomyces albipurpureus TaxID=2897419 RepID=A0ABT0UIQ5_9ACTN|nr:hypothetical protein [Streptomyces sp. CWNU-1]MCM2387191.1 hypothetical protein [Streptomyces sp. CWNU-1]
MRTRILLTSLATGAALLAGGTTAAQAAPAPSENRASTAQPARSTSGTTPIASAAGCASLVSNSAGRAQIKNICNYRINATVSVDWAWDPSCVAINAGRTQTVYWDAADGRADYAYEC